MPVISQHREQEHGLGHDEYMDDEDEEIGYQEHVIETESNHTIPNYDEASEIQKLTEAANNSLLHMEHQFQPPKKRGRKKRSDSNISLEDGSKPKRRRKPSYLRIPFSSERMQDPLEGLENLNLPIATAGTAPISPPGTKPPPKLKSPTTRVKQPIPAAIPPQPLLPPQKMTPLTPHEVAPSPPREVTPPLPPAFHPKMSPILSPQVVQAMLPRMPSPQVVPPQITVPPPMFSPQMTSPQITSPQMVSPKMLSPGQASQQLSPRSLSRTQQKHPLLSTILSVMGANSQSNNTVSSPSTIIPTHEFVPPRVPSGIPRPSGIPQQQVPFNPNQHIPSPVTPQIPVSYAVTQQLPPASTNFVASTPASRPVMAAIPQIPHDTLIPAIPGQLREQIPLRGEVPMQHQAQLRAPIPKQIPPIQQQQTQPNLLKQPLVMTIPIQVLAQRLQQAPPHLREHVLAQHLEQVPEHLRAQALLQLQQQVQEKLQQGKKLALQAQQQAQQIQESTASVPRPAVPYSHPMLLTTKTEPNSSANIKLRPQIPVVQAASSRPPIPQVLQQTINPGSVLSPIVSFNSQMSTAQLSTSGTISAAPLINDSKPSHVATVHNSISTPSHVISPTTKVEVAVSNVASSVSVLESSTQGQPSNEILSNKNVPSNQGLSTTQEVCSDTSVDIKPKLQDLIKSELLAAAWESRQPLPPEKLAEKSPATSSKSTSPQAQMMSEPSSYVVNTTAAPPTYTEEVRENSTTITTTAQVPTTLELPQPQLSAAVPRPSLMLPPISSLQNKIPAETIPSTLQSTVTFTRDPLHDSNMTSVLESPPVSEDKEVGDLPPPGQIAVPRGALRSPVSSSILGKDPMLSGSNMLSPPVTTEVLMEALGQPGSPAVSRPDDTKKVANKFTPPFPLAFTPGLPPVGLMMQPAAAQRPQIPGNIRAPGNQAGILPQDVQEQQPQQQQIIRSQAPDKVLNTLQKSHINPTAHTSQSLDMIMEIMKKELATNHQSGQAATQPARPPQPQPGPTMEMLMTIMQREMAAAQIQAHVAALHAAQAQTSHLQQQQVPVRQPTAGSAMPPQSQAGQLPPVRTVIPQNQTASTVRPSGLVSGQLIPGNTSAQTVRQAIPSSTQPSQFQVAIFLPSALPSTVIVLVLSICLSFHEYL